jgi:hypothetical protein
LRAALEVWALFSSVPMSGDVTVSELAAYSANEVVMYCDEFSYEIRWGSEETEQQASRLNVLWDRENGLLNCAEYLDLRFGEKLVCR